MHQTQKMHRNASQTFPVKLCASLQRSHLKPSPLKCLSKLTKMFFQHGQQEQFTAGRKQRSNNRWTFTEQEKFYCELSRLESGTVRHGPKAFFRGVRSSCIAERPFLFSFQRISSGSRGPLTRARSRACTAAVTNCTGSRRRHRKCRASTCPCVCCP